MPAPSKLILRVKNKKFSAFIIDLPVLGPGDDIVCRSCAPVRTKMHYKASVHLPARKGTDVYAVYECANCERQWCAWQFRPYQEGESE